LRIVEPIPFCCGMPWHARYFEDFETISAACMYCDRAIAVPLEAKDKKVACIYCGLDKGFLPAVEIEP
jgi:hypothetical protein